MRSCWCAGRTCLLLDEPTSALDLRHQVVVMDTLRRLAGEGRLVVAVLHDLALAARFADHIVVLSHGRCAAEGAPAGTLTPALLAQVYGVEARIEPARGAGSRSWWTAGDRCRAHGFREGLMEEATARYRGLRVLQVKRAIQLTPRMRRLVLGGPEFEGIPDGPNLKLLIPPQGLAVPKWPLQGADRRPIWPDEPERPTVRTYSVRRLDRVAGELWVDFVLHGAGGVAAAFAVRAQPGDPVGIGGPGGRDLPLADFHLLAADQSGLPSVAAILERLPMDARASPSWKWPMRPRNRPLSIPGACVSSISAAKDARPARPRCCTMPYWPWTGRHSLASVRGSLRNRPPRAACAAICVTFAGFRHVISWWSATGSAG